jgi:hypothetical protein
MCLEKVNTARLIQYAVVIVLCVAVAPLRSYSQLDSTRVTNESDSSGGQEAAPPLIPSTSAKVSTTKIVIIGGTVVVAMAGIVIYQDNGYWKDNRARFHFKEDLKYSLQVDKIAHFWDTALLSSVLSLSVEWANVPKKDAVLWGAGGSLLFNTFTEIQDGFSEWGFDRVDWLANLGGAFWYVGKNTVPFMENLDIKWNYYPSPNLDTPGAFTGQRHLIFDDYEGFTFWMSFKVNSVLPKSVEQFWPDFLCFAVGYGARDILKPDKYSVWYVGLDYDMTKIIPQDTWFLKSLSETLNYIHFPAPAIRISPGAIWYGLYIGR